MANMIERLYNFTIKKIEKATTSASVLPALKTNKGVCVNPLLLFL